METLTLIITIVLSIPVILTIKAASDESWRNFNKRFDNK